MVSGGADSQFSGRAALLRDLPLSHVPGAAGQVSLYPIHRWIERPRGRRGPRYGDGAAYHVRARPHRRERSGHGGIYADSLSRGVQRGTHGSRKQCTSAGPQGVRARGSARPRDGCRCVRRSARRAARISRARNRQRSRTRWRTKATTPSSSSSARPAMFLKRPHSAASAHKASSCARSSRRSSTGEST